MSRHKPPVAILALPTLSDPLLHIWTLYNLHMPLPPALDGGNDNTPPGVLANDTEGLREVIMRNRWRLVDHERKKRDGKKLCWQLKEKFAAIWPQVREFLGINFFVSLIRGQLREVL